VKRTQAAPAALTATATAALLLLLTACGGGGGGTPHAKITGAATKAASASPTPGDSPSGASDHGAPAFDFPSDVKVDFSGFDGGTARRRPVLRDATYAIRSILDVEVHDKDTANYQRYFFGLQVAQFGDSLIKWAKTRTITGTYRYYDPKVTFDKTGGAAVSYCESQRDGFAKLRATGKVETTQPSIKDFNLWTLHVSKDAKGDWQVNSYSLQNGARQCETG
jgi:hypothetical protein